MTRYAQNALVTVLFRIDFAQHVNLNTDELNKVCLVEYPIVSSETVNQTNINAFVDNNGVVQSKNDNITYENKIYSDRLQTRRIILSSQYVIAEILKYSSFEETKKSFTSIFENIRRSNPDTPVSRIGMRYINNIDLTSIKRTAWTQYVSKSIVDNIFLSVIEGSELTRTQNMVELTKDDYRIRCIYGLLNPDYPAVMRRNVVTLDFDAYLEGELESNAVEGYLDRFHFSIQMLFENSIASKQRQVMGICK